jgi:acyl carrier protein
MSTSLSIEETVRRIAERILRKKGIEFSPTTSFKDFGADSLDIVQILVAVEDTFDVELDDEELQNITDTAGFIAYIEKKIAEKNR